MLSILCALAGLIAFIVGLVNGNGQATVIGLGLFLGGAISFIRLTSSGKI